MNVKQHKLILPYKGKEGERTLKNVKGHITKLLPEQEGMTLVFTGTKLGTKFNIIDKTSKEHQHDLTCSVVCPDADCNKNIIAKQVGDSLKGFTSTVVKTLILMVSEIQLSLITQK